MKQWILDMSASYKAMWVGGIAGFWGWVDNINWLGVIGGLVAIGGFLVNFHFQWRRDKREAVESEARLKALEQRAPCRKTDYPSALDGNP